METLDLGIPSFTGQTMTLAANILYRHRIAPKIVSCIFIYWTLLYSVLVYKKQRKELPLREKNYF